MSVSRLWQLSHLEEVSMMILITSLLSLKLVLDRIFIFRESVI